MEEARESVLEGGLNTDDEVVRIEVIDVRTAT